MDGILGLVLSMLQADSTTAQSTPRLGAMRILMTSFESGERR
jgi:hypothetical protein